MHLITKDSFLNKAMTNDTLFLIQLSYTEYSLMTISQFASDSLAKIAARVFSHCFAVLGDVSSGMTGRPPTILAVSPSIFLYTQVIGHQ